MIRTRESRPTMEAATRTDEVNASVPQPWWADVDPWHQIDWWTNPAQSYLKGLQDGAALARGQMDAEHRANWQTTLQRLDQADARRAADRPGPRPGDFTGGSA